jgi:hypothetical protein
MSYDEHLISMAGGDGEAADALAAIEARLRSDKVHDLGTDQCVRDREHLLAIVREQRAVIERVEAIHQMQGDSYKTCSHCVRPSGYPNRSEQPVRWPCPTIAAITATEGS